MSPVATLIILGIASIVWFGFLRGHLASKERRGSGDSGGTDGGSNTGSDCGPDSGSCDGGGDGGGGGD